jgi:hypothetical protein
MRVWVVMIALGLLDGCIMPTCHAKCEDHVELDIHIDLAPNALGSAQMCVNTFCTAGSLASGAAGSGESLLSGDFVADARMASDASGTALTLTINGGGNGGLQDRHLSTARRHVR